MKQNRISHVVLCARCDHVMERREGKPKFFHKSQRHAYHHFPKEGAIVSEENRGVPNLYVVYVVYMYISRIIIFSSCH